MAALTHARQALELLLERWPELFLRRATNPALTMVSLTVSPPEDDDNDRVTPPIEVQLHFRFCFVLYFENFPGICVLNRFLFPKFIFFDVFFDFFSFLFIY